MNCFAVFFAWGGGDEGQKKFLGKVKSKKIFFSKIQGQKFFFSNSRKFLVTIERVWQDVDHPFAGLFV